MKIKDIELTPLQIPQKKIMRWADGHVTVTEHIIVKVIAEDGTYGVTEAIPRPGIYGETPVSIFNSLKNFIIPGIIGLDSFNLEKIWEKMDALPYNYAAKGSIDVAIHDLNGKLLNIPCHKLLGGPYRKEIELSWVSGGTWFEEELMLEEAGLKVAEGYKAIKVKAGHATDIDFALKLRKICPDDVKISIDPNQRYSREELLKVGYALTDVIDSIEEPIAAWDDEGRKKFSELFPKISLLSDESTFTFPETQHQMKLGAIKRLGIKIPRTGFTISRKLVHLAEINNMPVQICTQAECDLGSAACVQFAAAFKRINLPCEIGYFAKGIQDSLLQGDKLKIENGKMLLPDGPGNGVEPNWDFINKYAVKL